MESGWGLGGKGKGERGEGVVGGKWIRVPRGVTFERSIRFCPCTWQGQVVCKHQLLQK